MKKYTTLLFVFLLTMLVATNAWAAANRPTAASASAQGGVVNSGVYTITYTLPNGNGTETGTLSSAGLPGGCTGAFSTDGVNGNGTTVTGGTTVNFPANTSTGKIIFTISGSGTATNTITVTTTFTLPSGTVVTPTFSYNSALPVELISFNAIAKGNAVELAWKTATEVNNFGFDVEKNVSGSWSKIGFVEGNGTTNAPKSYNYIDAKVSGTVSYRLKQIDRDGKFEYSKTVETTVATPAVFALGQNYPNPFNPTTNIEFSVPNDGIATLAVYNTLGQHVATLYNGVAVAGRLNVATFDASQLSSGVYFSRLTFSGKQLMNKMLLQK